jgi:Tfp pilus assembly protein PilP
MTHQFPIRLAVVLTALAVPLMAAAQPAGQQTTAGQGARAAAKPASPKSASQAPAAARPAAKVAAPAPKPVSQPAPPAQETYSYRAEGRRDPFVSLLNRGSDPRAPRKAEGLAGLLVADAVLKGILQSRGTFLALVQGPDTKRPYIVHPNDRFADGVVKAITADSILILQEVNDPLSLTKQREIRKTLRAVEEVK